MRNILLLTLLFISSALIAGQWTEAESKFVVTVTKKQITTNTVYIDRYIPEEVATPTAEIATPTQDIGE